ncbi:VanZ family protein [Flavobacterium ovatum]|uniref:VanZ family protein n=1 Tax=Flavobacterium ovatum TaxID=1928857 RepID=UPI00344D475C
MLKKLFLSAATLWTSIVLVLCLIRLDGAPQVEVVNFDKYIHGVFHFIFTMLWFLFFKLHFKKENKFKPFVVSFLLSVSFGVLIEVLQQWCTQSRTGDLLDVLANMFGATVAIGLFYILDSYKFLSKIC